MKLVLTENEIKQAIRDWLQTYQDLYVLKEGIKIDYDECGEARAEIQWDK